MCCNGKINRFCGRFYVQPALPELFHFDLNLVVNEGTQTTLPLFCNLQTVVCTMFEIVLTSEKEETHTHIPMIRLQGQKTIKTMINCQE